MCRTCTGEYLPGPFPPLPPFYIILHRQKNANCLFIGGARIDETEEDVILADGGQQAPVLARRDVSIDNWDMVKDHQMKEAMGVGGVLRRTPRYSLTCRDVKRVAKGKAFAPR